MDTFVLYHDFNETYSHSPDSLEGVVGIVRDITVDYTGEELHKELIRTYAILTLFVNNKFDEYANMTGKVAYGPMHLYADNAGWDRRGAIKVFDALPRRYEMDEHLNVINSLMHILHSDYAIKEHWDLRQESLVPYCEIVEALSGDKIFNEIKYQVSNLGLLSDDSVPKAWRSSIEKILKDCGCACGDVFSWELEQNEYTDKNPIGRVAYLCVEVYGDSPETVENAIRALDRIDLAREDNRYIVTVYEGD